MVAETTTASTHDAFHGAYEEGDETFLRRAGTVAQRRHTRKAHQLAADAAAMSLAMSSPHPLPMPGTPMSIPSTASDTDYPGDASSIDMARSPTSSITTVDGRSFASVTSQSFEADNFTLPPLPQPHVPLRKTSATNLRQIAVSNSYDRSNTAEAESPRQSQFPERRSSLATSPRLPKDRQKQAAVGGTDDVSDKENVQVGPAPPRGRARGLTTVGQRLPGDSSSRFRSPSIPDLRGNARAHVSSTYKPERGPTASRDQSFAAPRIPPLPWKESEEVRQSFRSALTNASYVTYTSSAYDEPSETGRSSFVTRSSKYSNYSQQGTGSPDDDDDDDDFDACDYIDLYAVGFKDDDDMGQRSSRSSFRRAGTRSSAQSGHPNILDPAIQSPLSPYDEPDERPSSIQSPRPYSFSDSRPSSIQKLHSVTDETNAPTKCDSKFDEEEIIVPGSPPLPHSPPLSLSSPSSPALASHPVNPAAPPSPISPFPLSLKGEDPYASQPVSPLSRMDLSPIDAPVYQPSPLEEGAATGFFPPLKSSITASTVQTSLLKSSTISHEDATPRDRYGFTKASREISAEQYDAWNVGYSNYVQRRRTKWEIMLIQWGLPINSPQRFPPRSDKVKRYIRKGIPPEWRGACWFWYAGGPQRLAANPGLYEKRLREAAEGKMTAIVDGDIEKDLPRSFPDHVEFKIDTNAGEESNEEPPMIQALRRVLQAFAVDNPSIGYCQSLNYLAGIMLLFLKDEEKTFHLLNILCNVHMPGIHGQRLENIDVGVLMSCIRESLPQVWAKIDDINEGGRAPLSTTLPTVSLTCTAWFMACFVNNLPTESVLRVWDCLFYEGSKTLFRIALALFKSGQSELCAVNENETLQIVQGIPRRALDINTLMESCYKRRNGFGHLSQDVIDARRKERKAALQKERDLKNGQMSPHILQNMERPPSRGRSRGTKGTLSRAASRAASKARGVSRARSRKRGAEPISPDDIPPTPPMSRQGTGLGIGTKV